MSRVDGEGNEFVKKLMSFKIEGMNCRGMKVVIHNTSRLFVH